MRKNLQTSKMLIAGLTAMVLTGLSVFIGCSDDEWDGSPDFLYTNAAGLTRAGVEGENEIPLTEAQLVASCVPNGCALWCLTHIKGLTWKDFNDILNAAEEIGFKIGEGNGGLSPEQTYNIGKDVGIGFSGYYNSDKGKAVIMQKIKEISAEKDGFKKNKVIVFTDNHCSIATGWNKKTITIRDVNNGVSIDTASVNGLVY